MIPVITMQSHLFGFKEYDMASLTLRNLDDSRTYSSTSRVSGTMGT